MHLWRSFRWILRVCPFISVSVSLRTSWLFYEQDVLCQLPGRPLFCQASGSKQLNWTALHGPTYPFGTLTIMLYLAFFRLQGLSTDSLTKPPILIMNKTRPWLFWSGVCVSSEGGHQKSGESDSWSSSWLGPLIRSEWQENMGPHRYLPPTPAPSLLLPYGH